MELSGAQIIPAPRERVWAALNDPEVLRRCIPGCESLERVGENELRAVAKIAVGPISARFAGKVLLSDLDPPNGYRISGEGEGGAAGFARGGAVVRLEGQDETTLTYAAEAQVGGKLAQLGSRLIDATAKRLTEAFFARFAAELTPGAAAQAPGEATPVVRASTPAAVVQAPAAVSANWAVLTLILTVLAAAVGYLFGLQAR
ncbi:MAG: carbon monoxide dehydrogenase subunit G [Phenylobacterium sp.]